MSPPAANAGPSSSTTAPTASPNASQSCSDDINRSPEQKFLDANPEAIAWMLDLSATFVALAGSGAFLATTLLKLARQAAGCPWERLEGEPKLPECDETVHGMKPSSLISTYASVLGLAASAVMPIAGAIVDTTSYRRGIGRLLAASFSVTLFSTIFVNEDNWFAMSNMLAISGFVGWFEAMTLYAYLPELTNDEAALNRYTRTFTIFSSTSTVLYLILIVGVASAMGYNNDTDSLDDDIGTARLSQSVSSVILAVALSVSWGRLFRPRPPARSLGENESIWTSGFIELYKTSRKVHRQHPALQWFFVAIALSDGGATSLLYLAITYMTDQLEFSGAENGAALLIALVSSIPGGLLSSWCSKRYSPVSSTICALAVLTLNTTLVSLLLKSPDQKLGAYILVVGWGIGKGWKWTCDKLLYASILPPGQNAEFSGTYIFFRQCLTWLPPLVFTILNESDISLRWGLASLNVFFLLGMLTYYFGVGSYATAIEVSHNIQAGEDQGAPIDDSSHSSVNPREEDTPTRMDGVGSDDIVEDSSSSED